MWKIEISKQSQMFGWKRFQMQCKSLRIVEKLADMEDHLDIKRKERIWF